MLEFHFYIKLLSLELALSLVSQKHLTISSYLSEVLQTLEPSGLDYQPLSFIL